MMDCRCDTLDRIFDPEAGEYLAQHLVAEEGHAWAYECPSTGWRWAGGWLNGELRRYPRVGMAELLDAASVASRSEALEAAHQQVDRDFRAAQSSGTPREMGDAWKAHDESAFRFWLAWQAMYPQLWDSVKERLRRDDPEAIEAAVVFLEVDPWCFRSGYEKHTLMQALSQRDLVEPTKERLRAVVLHVLTQPPRREAGALAHLASTLWDPEMERRVKALQSSEERVAAQNASYLLKVLADSASD